MTGHWQPGLVTQPWAPREGWGGTQVVIFGSQRNILCFPAHPAGLGNCGGEKAGVITGRCPKEREPVTGAAPGQDLPARPSKVPILTGIPRRASPPALTPTAQISPERATLALKACALSSVSLPSGTPTLRAPQTPPSSISPLPRMRSSPRGHTRPAFLGLHRHPEGSDGPARCPPRSYRSYPAQSGSGKSRPRRSCRMTWRRRHGRTPAASDGSEARLDRKSVV